MKRRKTRNLCKKKKKRKERVILENSILSFHIRPSCLVKCVQFVIVVIGAQKKGAAAAGRFRHIFEFFFFFFKKDSRRVAKEHQKANIV